jgi:hypothetical protein
MDVILRISKKFSFFCTRLYLDPINEPHYTSAASGNNGGFYRGGNRYHFSPTTEKIVPE